MQKGASSKIGRDNSVNISFGQNSEFTYGHFINNIIGQRWQIVNSILLSEKFVKDIKLNPMYVEPNPLHLVCSIPSVPFKTVQNILNIYGNSCCLVEDEDGCLPIHIACSTPNLESKIIQLLIEACPATSFVRDQVRGEIPFFLLLSQNNTSTPCAIIESLPRHFFISNEGNTSIVHEACSQLLPNYLLDQILHRYPEISRIRNQNGVSIAHVICSHKQSTVNMMYTLQRHCSWLFAIKDYQGNLPLHLVNSEKHSEEIIGFLLSVYPQAIMVQNNEMHTPLSSRFIRYSPSKAKFMIQKSDFQLVRSALAMKPTITEELFYNLQQHVSSLCNSMQTEVNSLNFQQFHMKNSLLKDGIEYFFYVMTLLHYNVMEWPKSSVKNTMRGFTHNGSFWLQFPIFTKMLLHHHPQISLQKDSDGNLPLHIVARYNCSTFPLSCSICNDTINNGIFYWINKYNQRCTSCQTRCKRKAQHNQVPLIGCHGNDIAKDLIEIYPEAARVKDSNGSLPLHLSLQAGKKWLNDGVKEIFEAWPEALNSIDNEGLTPVMIASSLNGCDLTTVFELLRRDPCTVLGNRATKDLSQSSQTK